MLIGGVLVDIHAYPSIQTRLLLTTTSIQQRRLQFLPSRPAPPPLLSIHEHGTTSPNTDLYRRHRFRQGQRALRFLRYHEVRFTSFDAVVG